MHITGLPHSVSPGGSITGTVTIMNNGPRSWTSSSHHVVCGWENSSVLVPVGQITGSLDYGDIVHATWTTTAPSGQGVSTLTCQLVTGGTALATTSADTIVGPDNQFKAEITAFTLPASMPYGIDGDDAEPRTGLVTVRNGGTEAWTPQWLPQLALRSGPVKELTPLPGAVPVGATVSVPVEFVCLRAGSNTFSVQMTFSGVPISSTSKATVRCVGTDAMPGGD
jgi:hypothetical protein